MLPAFLTVSICPSVSPTFSIHLLYCLVVSILLRAPPTTTTTTTTAAAATPSPLLSLFLCLRPLLDCLCGERREKEGGLEHDSSRLIGKESARTWRHGRWERERVDMKNPFPPCERQREWERRGSILIDTQTGREAKKKWLSPYPLF